MPNGTQDIHVLVPLLFHIANLLSKLLDGVFECAILQLQVCNPRSVLDATQSKWPRLTLLLLGSRWLCRHD